MTDASGVPTSPDGIPTYNTPTDPPSGKGFNTAMAAIQTALSNRAKTPAGILTGEAMVWNGTTWVRSATQGLTPSGIAGYPADALKSLLGDGTWNNPHDYIAFVTQTNPQGPTVATTFAASGSFFGSSLSITFDGTSNYVVELSVPAWSNSSATANNLMGLSIDGSATEKMRIAEYTAPTAGAFTPLFAKAVLLAPAAGAALIQVKQYVGGGSATLTCGVGGAGNFGPAIMGIKRL